MKLRSESPGDLVDILGTMNETIKRDAERLKTDQRTQFMVETLTSIKNNRYMVRKSIAMGSDALLFC